MIKYTKAIINTPDIADLFNTVDRCGGISLFSSRTDDDREYTGLNPVIILTDYELLSGLHKQKITDPMRELDQLIEKYRYLPEELSILGYISYDFKDRLEEKGLYEKRAQGIFPDLYFALFEHYIISDRARNKAVTYTVQFPFDYKPITLDLLSFKKKSPRKITHYRGTSLDKKSHIDAVSQTIKYIGEGDLYQANITRAIYGETEFSPVENAMNLYYSNRIAYGVFASIGGGHVISTSPELFFKTKEGKITASPIKGTVSRGDSPYEDEKNKKELLSSEKNIAELAMIVDLMRNDLSLVCTPGTVKVPHFPLLMVLKNVYHLYANVVGELKSGIGIGEILKKTFPGGSITGCPKIRSCQIIDKLESVPRGIYTGSFGKIGFNGNCIFNIMIRSLFQSGNHIIFNVGGGITALSDPEKEFEETIHKGKNIWKAIRMEKIQEEQFCTGE